MVLSIDPSEIGLKVGLEIHQQLATGRKLFCACGQAESDEFTRRFTRRLRASKSETGRYDPAAIFEKAKSKVMVYSGASQSSCPVEGDEEPPHDPDPAAKETALLIASALGSRIFREIFVMRKIVIDGSNTSGFQRTALVSQGGVLKVGDRRVGVQSICLEEDAARLIGDSGDVREYSLDRLGVPLVEIALEPVESGPQETREIALALGKLLRTTKRVARGIGTIRQDVNVSVRGGGVVEVKGVQQLDQLEKAIAFEAKRQHGLTRIAQKMQGRDVVPRGDDIFCVSDLLQDCGSKIIQKSLRDGSVIRAIRVRDFAGLFGYEPYPGVRVGLEIAQVVRALGVGGVFHSDELPGYGIGDGDVAAIRSRLLASDGDGFLIVAAGPSRIDSVTDAIVNRIRQAQEGVPAETRQVTPGGETVFLRPRPGAARMYPETDIAPIPVTLQELRRAEADVPRPWDDLLAGLVARYRLNPQLAEQVLDSRYLEIFEEIAGRGAVPPNFVASTLCSTITGLQRRGLAAELASQDIRDAFDLLSSGRIPKESVELIFESIMSGASRTAQEAVSRLGIGTMDPQELEEILMGIAKDNRDMILRQKERAAGFLMGAAMKQLRGKAPGSAINSKLQQIIREMTKEKSG